MAQENHSSSVLYDDSDRYDSEPKTAIEIPWWMDGGFRIGIHTSIAGDVGRALDFAHRLGANALQIFSSSPRMWAGVEGEKRLTTLEADRFRVRRRELELYPLVIHDNYLINLASPERMLRARSVQAFHEELVRALALGADFLVTHPGSSRSADRGQAIATIAQGLRQATRGLRFEGLRILLENTAGQGTSVGSSFEELQAILEACPDLPLGVCLDTAHLFQAGYDIRLAEGLERTLEGIEKTLGLARVFVVHVNDSKTPLGSRVDRHEHIGKGHIGLKAFGGILNHPLLAGRAFILETPIDKPGDDRRNVRALWKLVGQKVRQAPRAENGFTMYRKSRKDRPGRPASAEKRAPARSKASGR
jgi:deoxyribonuclease-4